MNECRLDNFPALHHHGNEILSKLPLVLEEDVFKIQQNHAVRPEVSRGLLTGDAPLSSGDFGRWLWPRLAGLPVNDRGLQ